MVSIRNNLKENPQTSPSRSARSPACGREACLPVLACLRAGADTAVGQAGWNFIQNRSRILGGGLLKKMCILVTIFDSGKFNYY